MKIALTILLLPTLALSQAGQGQSSATRPHEPPSVKLISAGTKPLAPLRYGLKNPQQLTILASGDWRMSAPVGSSTSTFPNLTTPVVLTPHKSAIQYDWLASSFTGPPAGSKLETMTGLLLSGLDGSGGLFKADARGIIEGFMLKPGPNDTTLDAGTMQKRSVYALQMGKGMLGLLVVPLPEEAIGLGGKWQVERLAIRGSLSFIQVTTYTLEARVGDVLELSYRFGAKWDPGCGFKQSELKLAISGGGKATVDLALPLPSALVDEILRE